MSCETAQELYLAALSGGNPRAGEADRHLASCRACEAAVRRLGATWAALGALPAVEPSPEVAPRLYRRVRRLALGERLASVERWQEAALAGVLAFIVSLVLALAVPYDTLVALCRDAASAVLPTPGAYLLAGVVYGLVPMAIGAALQARRTKAPSLIGAFATWLVFLVVLLPYAAVRCSEFPLALLVGFLAGIAAGGLAGGAAGIGLARRPAWV